VSYRNVAAPAAGPAVVQIGEAEIVAPVGVVENLKLNADSAKAIAASRSRSARH